jgi:hypothetical protein
MQKCLFHRNDECESGRADSVSGKMKWCVAATGAHFRGRASGQDFLVLDLPKMSSEGDLHLIAQCPLGKELRKSLE